MKGAGERRRRGALAAGSIHVLLALSHLVHKSRKGMLCEGPAKNGDTHSAGRKREESSPTEGWRRRRRKGRTNKSGRFFARARNGTGSIQIHTHAHVFARSDQSVPTRWRRSYIKLHALLAFFISCNTSFVFVALLSAHSRSAVKGCRTTPSQLIAHYSFN